ncbi:unnamed protein product [Arctogadus glacialis]
MTILPCRMTYICVEPRLTFPVSDGLSPAGSGYLSTLYHKQAWTVINNGERQYNI